MEKYILQVQDHFDAAHFLKDYKGKCSMMHGHTWDIILKVSTQTLDNIGMGLDFKSLKEILKSETEKYDHKIINDTAPFTEINPTAENLAREIFMSAQKKIPKNIKIESVTVWESPQACATYQTSD